MQGEAVGGQARLSALLTVDEHHDVLDDQVHVLVWGVVGCRCLHGGRRRLPAHLQGVDGLHDRRAAGDEVLYDEARLSRGKRALDRFLGAIILDLLAAHEHGRAMQ